MDEMARGHMIADVVAIIGTRTSCSARSTDERVSGRRRRTTREVGMLSTGARIRRIDREIAKYPPTRSSRR
jgi:hypothetical protein